MCTIKINSIPSITRPIKAREKAFSSKIEKEILLSAYLEPGEEKILDNVISFVNESYGKVLLLLRYKPKKGYYVEAFDRNQELVLGCPISKNRTYVLRSRFAWDKLYGEEEIFQLIPKVERSFDE